MYAGLLIDELIKQVEHAEHNILLEIFSTEARNGAEVIASDTPRAYSNHFSGPLAAGSGIGEAIRPHGEI